MDDIYFLGIDAGGTKTCFKLCDTYGNAVKEIIGANCNSFDIGITRAMEVLKSGIQDVCENVPYSSVSMYAGIAGGGNAIAKKQYEDFFAKFGFAAFDNGSDNENIISAGLGEKSGITLIMGTGVCLYKKNGRHHTKISGWGYLFDDGGSAFNFGQDAIKAYFAELDGYGRNTVLSQAIENQSGRTGIELLPKLYEGGKKYIASFAPLVFECAEKYGDTVSIDIINRNVAFIAKLINTASKEFQGSMERIPVLVTGGLTKQPKLIEYIYQALGQPQNIEIKLLIIPPVDGAVKKARQLWNERKGHMIC